MRCRDVAGLALLYEPEVLLVTAAIAPGPGASVHAAALADAGERMSTVEVLCDDGEPAPGSLDALTLKQAEGARAWADYVGEVAGAFALLVEARRVGVRQVVADGPHCPRFHVDRVAVRGVLTVLGPGTEWLPNSELDRSRLGHAGGDDDLTSGLVKRWELLGQADTGSLALFKGTAWPGIGDRAVVHRSPPADGTRRVVLTLDWLD
ncbi:MAG: DUF1826 domain-containing protein [Planctomycetota bacterium]|nr:DUF1826 domain-containing protein [Planctomycetota bacterium]